MTSSGAGSGPSPAGQDGNHLHQGIERNPTLCARGPMIVHPSSLAVSQRLELPPAGKLRRGRGISLPPGQAKSPLVFTVGPRGSGAQRCLALPRRYGSSTRPSRPAGSRVARTGPLCQRERQAFITAWVTHGMPCGNPFDPSGTGARITNTNHVPTGSRPRQQRPPARANGQLASAPRSPGKERIVLART